MCTVRKEKAPRCRDGSLKTAKEDRRRTERTTYQNMIFPGKGYCLSKIMKSILKLQETF